MAKHLNLWSTWATEGPLLGPGGHAPSVQEAAYRPRDIAKQRELARTSDQLEQQARGSFRTFAQVSGLGASIWGTEGPEFKSRQPDRNNPVYLTGLDHD